MTCVFVRIPHIEKEYLDLLTEGKSLSRKKYTHKSGHAHTHTHTHTNFMLSQHLVKSETAHAPTNLKQSEGLAGADCSGHYSGLSDSLPCSPHLSALYKDRPYGPLSHPCSNAAPLRPWSDNLGMVWILLNPTTRDSQTTFKN